MRDVSDMIRQSLLDEAHGNIGLAFEMACKRLSVEFFHAEELEAEVAQWRRGASWAYLRLQKASDPKPLDVPPDPITDCWIETGRESA